MLRNRLFSVLHQRNLPTVMKPLKVAKSTEELKCSFWSTSALRRGSLGYSSSVRPYADTRMSSDTPVLYSMDISPPCRAVLMTIKALSLDVEIKTLDLTKAENKSSSYMHLNPLHKIPTLSHEDLTITDSHAICTYLFNRFSPTSLLYPQSPKSRARVDQMLCFDMCHLFARNSAFMNDFFKNGKNTNNHELVSGIEEIYGFLDKFCMKSKWLAGEQITLADLCCGASVSSAVLLVPLDKALYPSAADWFQRCNEESLFKDVNQPGVENLKKLMKARSSY